MVGAYGHVDDFIEQRPGFVQPIITHHFFGDYTQCLTSVGDKFRVLGCGGSSKKIFWSVGSKLVWSWIKDHLWEVSGGCALSGLASFLWGLEWPVWFFGIGFIACLILWVWDKWGKSRVRSQTKCLEEFSNLTKDQVRHLTGALKIAKADSSTETLGSLLGTFWGIKNELLKAGIQTPRIPWGKNRETRLAQWKHICDLLQHTVGNGAQEYNDWRFFATESKKIADQGK